MSQDSTTRSGRNGHLARRDVLLGGTAIAAAGALIGLDGLVTPARAQAAPRPNIVYIVSDDQGWRDAGFNGSTEIRTPNLDRLAKTGTVFEQFYALPMCTPSRATLMTGRYPFRYGLQTGVIPSGGAYGLSLDEYLLPQALKDAGYRTAMVGKWHLGHARREFWPRQRGFDSYYGPLVGEIDHFKHTAHGVVDWYRENSVLQEEGYDTDLFGAEAVRIIQGHDKQKPLFLYLAFTAPHTPYQAPAAYLETYKHIADESKRNYAGQITAMDDAIGKVVAALDAAGLRDNTLIVFHSDNGGTRSAIFTGESAVKGELPPNNGVYRDGKGTLYEGGTRVCGFANWPGKVPAGRAKGLVHIADMYPTLTGLAGARTGKAKPLDGYDMWGHIARGEKSPRTELVYNVEPFRVAVRQGDLKLLWVPILPSRVELYDLAKDPSEKTNIAEKSARQVEKLKRRAEELAKAAVPPLLMGEMIKTTFSQPPSTPKGDEPPAPSANGAAHTKDFVTDMESGTD
ncbi:arylsulfatase [Prosthecomicrobium sp. N25]|uniref:arylsulfatase n=1 Tax=Prosthecomicrobium sp. N25 TaxID=3129254 RepID=UPI003077A1F2